MCDAQLKLVAWLDGEVPTDEAAAIEAHLRECETCQARIVAYKNASEGFNLCCDALFITKAKAKTLRWVPAIPVAAAAVLILSFVVFSRRLAAPPSLPEVSPVAVSTLSTVPTPVPVPSPALHKPVHRKPSRPPAPQSVQRWQPAERAVEIAIPAESIFAPGAMPEGMRIIGELRIGPDGSVRQVRFRQ